MTEEFEDKRVPLHQSELDAETLEALFADLEALCEIIAVLPKGGALEHSSGDATLREGQSMLLSGAIRGLQIRYLYNGEEWWDTLIARDGKVLITRISQQFRD